MSHSKRSISGSFMTHLCTYILVVSITDMPLRNPSGHKKVCWMELLYNFLKKSDSSSIWSFSTCFSFLHQNSPKCMAFWKLEKKKITWEMLWLYQLEHNRVIDIDLSFIVPNWLLCCHFPKIIQNIWSLCQSDFCPPNTFLPKVKGWSME